MAVTKMNRGLTLVELMITLVILATLVTIGIVTLRGYLPRQQLLASVQVVENTLQRAQAEASSRSLWSCVKFTTESATVWIDKNGSHTTTETACGDNGDIAIGAEAKFRGHTALASCSSLTNHVWFNTLGQPQTCKTVAGVIVCDNADIEIVLSTTDLASGARAREIEVTSGGLIQTVKPGEKGMIETRWAKFGTETGGCQ